VGDVLVEAALDGVLDVLGRHLTIDRRPELDAGLHVHRDGLAVLGDLGRPGRDVGRRYALVLRLVRVQRPTVRVLDLVAELVIGRAAVDVVDVGVGQDRERSALLGARRRGGLGVAATAAAAAATTGGDEYGGKAAGAQHHKDPQSGPAHEHSFPRWTYQGTSSYLRERGFSASENPSPSRLNASTQMSSASPGKTMYHQAVSNWLEASWIIFPQLGVGGCTPTPRNDRAASNRMLVGMKIVV